MTAIESVHRSGILEIESTMLSQLRDLPAARTLPRGFLTNLYKKADESLRKQSEVTTRELESPPADVKRAVDTMLAKIGEGDPVKGLQVFRSQRAACSGCHRMGYIGKEIGPDLTHIGGARTAEALLEAILYPSARLEQSYQSTQVLTTDGQSYNGLLRPSNDDSVELILNAERKVVIPRDEIDDMQASNLSVMPQGIDQLLTPQDLADLLALLRSAQ
jgi:putative heme-binding domain-containing protein